MYQTYAGDHSSKIYLISTSVQLGLASSIRIVRYFNKFKKYYPPVKRQMYWLPISVAKSRIIYPDDSN